MNIVNTHDQLVAAGGGIAIVKNHSPSGYFMGWSVYRVGKDGKERPTDPNAHWADYGRKGFTSPENDRGKAALEKAKAWVRETFPDAPHDWVRNRMGDYICKDINTRFPLRKEDA